MNLSFLYAVTFEQVVSWIEAALWAGGFLFLFFLIAGLFLNLWLNSRRAKFRERNPYITLAIDIPPEEIKSPKAIENIIAQVYAFKSVFRFHEKWWKGEHTLQASLEIIGQDGYVQFIARVPHKYRTLFERALYAQYPDIEITPVDDYTDAMSVEDFAGERKNGRYDLWGTEFVMAREAFFPLRTYPLFFDGSGKEFSDPLIAVLEMLSHLRRGERFWYQVTAAPTRVDWQGKGVSAIKAMVDGTFGKKKKKANLFAPIFGIFAEVLRLFIEIITGGGQVADTKKKVRAQIDDKLMTLVPPETDLIVKAIREKVSRLGFVTYVRALYIARTGVFDPSQVLGDFQGIMRQYANPQMNSLSSNKYIEVEYPQIFFPKLRAKWRKRRLLRRAKRRYCGLSVDEPARVNPFATDMVATKNIFHLQ